MPLLRSGFPSNGKRNQPNADVSTFVEEALGSASHLRPAKGRSICREAPMKIAEFLDPPAVTHELVSSTKPEILRELCETLVQAHPQLKSERLVDVLKEREKLGSTGIGEGVAIPHGKLAGLTRLTACFGVSRKGVDFEAIDGKPTQLFFVLLAPENSAGLHLKALARISRLFKNPRFRESILQANNATEIYELIAQEDAKA
jgi:PTS system nitrogen regulatory IIA component